VTVRVKQADSREIVINLRVYDADCLESSKGTGSLCSPSPQLAVRNAGGRRLVLVLEETPELADDSHEVDDGDEAQYVGHRAEPFSGTRMADVDVPVRGQGDRQPD